MTGRFLWTCSRGVLSRFALGDMLDGRARSLIAQTQFPVATKASFLSAEGEGLWLGDFLKRREGLQARAVFYPLDAEARPASRPTRVWLIPDGVQGLAVCAGLVALSRSGGPKDSTLELHRPPGEDGRLNETTLLRAVTLPAGSQDLDCAGDKLLVVFESAALPYKDQWLKAGAGIEDSVFALSLQPLEK